MLLELAEKFHAKARVAGEYCPESTAKFLIGMIGSDHACVFVSERGMIGGLAWPSQWSKDYLQAIESFWWAEDGHGRELADAFEAWAKAKGAKSTQMCFLHSLMPEKVEKMLRMRGYKPLETNMVK